MRLSVNETVRTLVGLYLPSALVSIGQGMLAPITPALADAFDVPLGLAAQVIGANLLGRLVLMIPSGYLVDRYGARFAMRSGPILILACSVATLLTPSFALLLVAQFLAGGGSGLWQLGRELVAVDLVASNARGRVMSLFIGLSSAGSAIGPLVGGVLNDTIGFRGVFAAAVVVALFVLVISFTVAEEAKPLAPRAKPSSRLGGIREIDPLFQMTYILMIFGTLAATLRQTVGTAMLPLYAGAELGFSSSEVGLLLGITGMTNLAVLGVAGWVSDTWGRKAAVVPAAAMGAVGFLLFPFTTSFLALALNCALLGVASGFALGSMTVYTYDIVPAHARGRLQSLRRVIGQTAGTFGPILGGVIASVSAPHVVFLVLAPVLVASALLIGFFARESAGKHAHPVAGVELAPEKA